MKRRRFISIFLRALGLVLMPFKRQKKERERDCYQDDLEKVTLGAMMLDPMKIDDVLSKVDSRHFVRPEHSCILRTIEALRRGGRPCHLHGVVAAMENAGTLEDIGGYSTLVDMVECTPTSEHALHYAELLIDHRHVRVA